MNDLLLCKNKLIRYISKNNLTDTLNILGLFDTENTLEEILDILVNFDSSDISEQAIEIICEHLLVSSSYKIERTGMKLGLHRMEQILSLLGNPQKNMKVIHIAGTNGKGSVSSYLKDVLKAKYKVGMYSSPGLISFNDRIRINDTFITYKKAYSLFIDILNIWKEHNSDCNDNLSFFEILTAVALVFFKEQNCDFIIMEVGLGGRYDGTNVFEEKLLSIITRIGLDHTAILGNTIEEIAFEKAGIIKNNDNVIIYPAQESVVKVISNICKEKNSMLTILDKSNIDILNIREKDSSFSFKNYKNVTINMLGEHQIYNCSLALLALNNLKERKIIDISENEILNSLKNSSWAGRLEWIKPNILLDGAHNKDGMDSLVDYLNKQQFKNLKILIGILEDKDYEDMIEKLETVNAEFFVTTVPIAIKDSSVDKITSCFASKNIISYPNFEVALHHLLPELKDDETLVISGSLYLVSEVRQYILNL